MKNHYLFEPSCLMSKKTCLHLLPSIFKYQPKCKCAASASIPFPNTQTLLLRDGIKSQNQQRAFLSQWISKLLMPTDNLKQSNRCLTYHHHVIFNTSSDTICSQYFLHQTHSDKSFRNRGRKGRGEHHLHIKERTGIYLHLHIFQNSC